MLMPARLALAFVAALALCVGLPTRADAGDPLYPVRLFSAVSPRAAHPLARVTVPAGYRIVGGGAAVNWGTREGVTGSFDNAPGSLLFASYPESTRVWVARSKDHYLGSEATVTAFAYAIFDPKDQLQVKIHSEQAPGGTVTDASVRVPDDRVMTGGGAHVLWKKGGSLLVQNRPLGADRWFARAKDHGNDDPAPVTVYAISVLRRPGPPMAHAEFVNDFTTSAPTPGRSARPDALAPPPSAERAFAGATSPMIGVLTGGGGWLEWQGPGAGPAGLLLTYLAATPAGFRVGGKDHMVTTVGKATAVGIVLRSAARLEEGFDRPGMDYATRDGVSGPRQCRTHCEADWWCTAFTYNPADQRCWLKHGVPGKRGYPGLFSGTMPRERRMTRPAQPGRFEPTSRAAPMATVEIGSSTPEDCHRQCLGRPTCVAYTYRDPRPMNQPATCAMYDTQDGRQLPDPGASTVIIDGRSAAPVSLPVPGTSPPLTVRWPLLIEPLKANAVDAYHGEGTVLFQQGWRLANLEQVRAVFRGLGDQPAFAGPFWYKPHGMVDWCLTRLSPLLARGSSQPVQMSPDRCRREKYRPLLVRQ